MISITSTGDVITISGLLPDSDLRFEINQDTLDLTEFAISVSKSDILIDITPADIEAYKSAYPSLSPLHEQFVNYLYRIIQAFNDSFNSVFEQSVEVPF